MPTARMLCIFDAVPCVVMLYASDLERECVCVGFLFLVKFISILLCMCCIADFAMGFMRAAPFLRQYYSLQYWKLPKTTRPSPTSLYTICAYKQALCACVFVAGCFFSHSSSSSICSSNKSPIVCCKRAFVFACCM